MVVALSAEMMSAIVVRNKIPIKILINHCVIDAVQIIDVIVIILGVSASKFAQFGYDQQFIGKRLCFQS